jgi:glutamate racemase
LSVLFQETRFSKNEEIHVKGIVETGVKRLVRELGRFPQSMVAIFGTPTTIDEGTFARLLQQQGIEQKRMVSQACPSLADTISEDRRGSSARNKIEKYVDAALEKATVFRSHYLIYLACTHYGYRKDYFSEKFADRGIDTQLLDPNEFAIEDLFLMSGKNEREHAGVCDVEVEFITRYRIPETALETISFFLDNVSSKTVQAFTNYNHAPDLF